jgi:hypothetical protein
MRPLWFSILTDVNGQQVGTTEQSERLMCNVFEQKSGAE